MHTWRKGIASWKCGETLYISVPFTWLMPEAEKLAATHKGPVRWLEHIPYDDFEYREDERKQIALF